MSSYDKSYSAVLPSYIHEIPGSRSEQYSTTDFTATAEFTCPYDRRVSGTYALFRAIYNSPRTYFNYYLPAEAQSVSMSLFGAEGIAQAANASYCANTMCKLSVQYKGFARPGALTIQEQIQPSFNMRQLPSWGYYWRSDGSPVLDNESPAIQEVKTDITRTFTNLHFIPSWFYNLAGCVNNAVWVDQVTGVVYLPGTLLFVPTNFSREITFARGNEDYNWTIAFTLKWNPVGWNNFIRPNGVDTMMKSGSQVCLYPYADFSTLGSDLFSLSDENACILFSFKATLVDASSNKCYDIYVERSGAWHIDSDADGGVLYYSCSYGSDAADPLTYDGSL